MKRIFRCTARCQWRGQLWAIGETVEIGEGAETPPSFFFAETEQEDSAPKKGRRKVKSDDESVGDQ